MVQTGDDDALVQDNGLGPGDPTADRQPGVFKKHFQAESMGAADASPPTHHPRP